MAEDNIIRKLRKGRGYTQGELAELSGSSQGYISRIERGSCSPNRDLIRRLAAALGVRPALLIRAIGWECPLRGESQPH